MESSSHPQLAASLQPYKLSYPQLLQLIRSHWNQTSQSMNDTDFRFIQDIQLLNQSALSKFAAITQIDDDALNEKPTSIEIKISLYVLYALICLLGIIGNAMVCFVVIRNPIMHTVTNIFILNLALSDILLCIFAPFNPLYLIAYKSWVFGTVLCHLVPFAQGVSIYISVFTLMGIAIDRYFVILYPFKSRMVMKTCVLIIIAIWISASILTAPYAHFMKLVEVSEESEPETSAIHYCDENWPSDETRKTFGISTTILQFVIPFVIITFCYVRVCGKLWDRAKAIPGSVSARREEQERERARKTNGMLISMVVIFVISWLPLNINNLLVDFYLEAASWHYSRAIFLAFHAMAMSSTCYNPFLYAWLNENFRREFKQLLPCCSKIKRNILSTTLVELQPQNKPKPNTKRCVQLHSKNGKSKVSISQVDEDTDHKLIFEENKSSSQVEVHC